MDNFGFIYSPSVASGLNYLGMWDALSNVPFLSSGVGTNGNYYIVGVAGNTDLDGITDWQIGDWAIFNGTAWQKIDNTDSITGAGLANEITYWTAPNQIGSLTTATYPSLLELSYVKGVTSGIQTQLNGKEPSITTLPISKGGTNSGTALTNNKVMISVAGQIIEGNTATYPDTTELSYVKGVTSSIQTQINGKEPAFTTLPISKGGTNSGTALTNNKVMISVAGQIVEGNTTTYPSTTELSYVKGVTSSIQTQLDKIGEYIVLGAATTNPAQNTTYYLGSIQSLSLTASATARTFKFLHSGTLDEAILMVSTANNASAENCTLQLYNVTTASAVATIGTFTYDAGTNGNKFFSYTGIAASVNTTDVYAIRIITATTFSTAPTGVYHNLRLKTKY